MIVLKTENLISGYEGVPVLHGISIVVQEGEIAAVVGPNGAGKTTLLKAVFGLLPVIKGRVTFCETDLDGMKAVARRRLGMSLVPQSGGTFPDLTVADNLRVSYSILGGRRQIQEAVEDAYRMFPALAERRRQLARTLSGGERQMLTFVSGIAGKPRLLALDEPTAGLAPTLVQGLLEAIASFRQGGSGVLLVVEENPLQVLPYVDRVYVLRAGAIQAAMTADEILGRDDLEMLFFGTAG